MNANQTMKLDRVALIRSRVEARAEYASDFELVPLSCVEPGTFILSMVEETIATMEIEERMQAVSDSLCDVVPSDFASKCDRISGQFDLLEGFHALDVADFIDASFEIMGVSR